MRAIIIVTVVVKDVAALMDGVVMQLIVMMELIIRLQRPKTPQNFKIFVTPKQLTENTASTISFLNKIWDLVKTMKFS